MATLVFVPEIKEQLLSLGFEPLANTPQEFAKVMKDEFARWQRAVKASGAEAN
jgi:tripartite-type tricarboxylate transporter receptor subunit TctC